LEMIGIIWVELEKYNLKILKEDNIVKIKKLIALKWKIHLEDCS